MKSKNSNPITLIVTRESVCAGDDIDAPHTKKIIIPFSVCTDDIMREIMSRYSLPTICGGMATWVCNIDDVDVAVLAQQWSAVKVKVRNCSLNENSRIHFIYYAQKEPESYL